MKLLAACFLCFICTACGFYNTSFDCPPGRGIGCTSVNEVLDMIVEREKEEDLFVTDLGEVLLLRQEEKSKVLITSRPPREKKPKLHLVKKENSGELVLMEETE